MEFGIGVICGAILGGVWTGWVMQRSLNRQTVIPTGTPKPAKIYTPTEYDRERKSKDMVKRVKKTRMQEAEKAWRETTNLPIPFTPIRSK